MIGAMVLRRVLYCVRMMPWFAVFLCSAMGPELVACTREADQTDVTTPVEARSDAPAAQVSEQAINTAMESARTYIAKGDLLSAQTILETVIEKAPNHVRPVEQLGQVLYSRSLEMRKPKAAATLRHQAAKMYRKAVDLDPESAGLRHSAGLIMLAAGDQAEALAMFESAGILDPTSPQHPLFAAQLYIQAEKYDQAEQLLQRALELDSTLPHAHASLAIIAMERSDFEMAIERITRARTYDPTSLDFRAIEARILRRSGKPREALQRLVTLPQQTRAQTNIAMEIAAAYRDIDSPQLAAKAWQIAYTHQVNQQGAWLAAAKAADALIDAGQREQALMWIRRAEAIAPQEQLVRDVRDRLSQSGSND